MSENQYIVLDLETFRAASDCRHCWKAEEGHCPCYEPIGWEDHVLLGLAIGSYWNSADSQFHWFDPETLEPTMRRLVEQQPLLVSFNGIRFDCPLMRSLLLEEAEGWVLLGDAGRGEALRDLCATFEAQCATSYDILAEIWRVAGRPATKGLNALEALCAANNLPRKAMTGAMAPRLWQEGRHAEVIEYNACDVIRTKRLFEMVCRGEPIRRADGSALMLRRPWPVDRPTQRTLTELLGPEMAQAVREVDAQGKEP